MVEKFHKIVEKVGLYKAIKLFGGFQKFKEIVESQPELTQYLDELKGSCSVSLVNTPDAYFDFYILDYDIMDEDFVELIVDMTVDFKNLSGEEIYQLKQWIGAVADDHGFEIYDIENLPSHRNLFIKSFNGRPYNWPGYDDVISDQEAIELLDKTGLWEGMIREEIFLNESIHFFKNEKYDNDPNYIKFKNVLTQLENKPGNKYTDFTDLDRTLKIKYVEPDNDRINIYVYVEGIGESDNEFEYFTKYGDDEISHESDLNIRKYFYPYIDTSISEERQKPFKQIISKRLYKLRSLIGMDNKFYRINIIP